MTRSPGLCGCPATCSVIESILTLQLLAVKIPQMRRTQVVAFRTARKQDIDEASLHSPLCLGREDQQGIELMVDNVK